MKIQDKVISKKDGAFSNEIHKMVLDKIEDALNGEIIGGMEVLSPKAWVDLLKLCLEYRLLDYREEEPQKPDKGMLKVLGG